MIYKQPAKQVHRGFIYLNDEMVTNSLSAVEAGKVDEIIAKVATAREGGIAGGLGVSGAKVEGGKKATSAYEEEIVKRRTQFSVFEAWYSNLRDARAIGEFDGWGEDALEGVGPGDALEMRAELRVAPLQSIFRLFFWFAEQAKAQGTMFSQKGEELKGTKDAERNMRTLMGDSNIGEIPLTATPVGKPGPNVVLTLQDQWMVSPIGGLNGTYSVVGQVERVLAAGEEWPTMRLTKDAPSTPLELRTLKDAVSHFVEPAKALGVDIDESATSIGGPALILTPLAIYR